MYRDHRADLRSFKTIVLAVLAFSIMCSDGFGFYQAEKGRWMSRDPIKEKGFIQQNEITYWLFLYNARRDHIKTLAYDFVNNAPIGKIDYRGTFILCKCVVSIPLQMKGPCFPGEEKGGIRWDGLCQGRWGWCNKLCLQSCYALTRYMCREDGSRFDLQNKDPWTSSCQW
jgi:hypothetical protein